VQAPEQGRRMSQVTDSWRVRSQPNDGRNRAAAIDCYFKARVIGRSG